MKLKDKVALVTGAASGLGRAAAFRFAAEGALVGALDHNENGVRETVAAIESRGGNALALHADVSLAASMSAAVENLVNAGERIIANLVLFLCSDEASFISGTEMWIDGTMSLFMG